MLNLILEEIDKNNFTEPEPKCYYLNGFTSSADTFRKLATLTAYVIVSTMPHTTNKISFRASATKQNKIEIFLLRFFCYLDLPLRVVLLPFTLFL